VWVLKEGPTSDRTFQAAAVLSNGATFWAGSSANLEHFKCLTVVNDLGWRSEILLGTSYSVKWIFASMFADMKPLASGQRAL